MIALLLLPGAASAAFATEAQQSQAPRQQPPAAQQPPAQQQHPAASSSGTASPGSDLFSIDHIRRELERQPTLTFTMPDPNLPLFRLRIEGYHYQLPTWQQNFVVPHSPVPVPLGGSDFYEMQRLNTAPQAWGSAPFTNSDLLKMSGLSGAYGLAGALIKKGLEARADAAVARARAEVRQELADVAAHNARVAAGQPDESPDAKAAAEKKKRDEEKKKQDEAKKKKKDDGGRQFLVPGP